MTKFWLGLTGSIGMGKSTTADMFRDAGVKVWDADETVHELYAEGGAAVPLIADVYPEAIVDGAVSRPVLKNIIAGDLAALGVIESIVHPLVTQSRELFRDQNDGLIVFDIPLLFEIKADDWLDAVLVVSTPEHIQRERVFARPGMTEELFEDISSRQLPDDEKRARADFVIETISMDQTRKEVNDLIAELKGRMVDA